MRDCVNETVKEIYTLRTLFVSITMIINESNHCDIINLISVVRYNQSNDYD